MHLRMLFWGRNHHLKAVRCLQPAAVELLLHRGCRAQEADTAHARRTHAATGRVGDVQQRDGDRTLDSRGHAVHRVRAEQQ